jgi:hypothetical protein
MHSFAIFAEPLDPAPPHPGQTGVYYVSAGDDIPAAGALPPNTTTLAFGPGVHRVPRNSHGFQLYTLPEAVRVHLALGSVVHTALQTDPAANAASSNISICGYGVLSGEENLREAHADSRHTFRGTPHAGCKDNISPQGITISGGARAQITGVTLVDHPNHHIIAKVSSGCEDGEPRGKVHNIKILGWRANGDGLHVFSSWKVSDLFMRTQDDSMYTAMMKDGPPPGCPQPSFERLSVWNDANGASFVVTGVGSTLRDSDVLYARASYAWWTGGRVFSTRRMGPVANVTIFNIRVHDPLPSLNAFQIDESDGSPGEVMLPWDGYVGATSTHRSFHDVAFVDITIANLSTMRKCKGHSGCNCVPACANGGLLPAGIPNQLRGGSKASNHNNITRVNFRNISIGGVGLRALPPSWMNVSGDVSHVTIDGHPLLAA